MPNIVVSVIGPPGYAAGLGKKGTSTDLTLYNAKKGENTVTFIEPTRYPERLAPLFYSTSLAQKAIVVVDELNSNFGESILMLQCSGVTSGYFRLKKLHSTRKNRPTHQRNKTGKIRIRARRPQFHQRPTTQSNWNRTKQTRPNQPNQSAPFPLTTASTSKASEQLYLA